MVGNFKIAVGKVGTSNQLPTIVLYYRIHSIDYSRYEVPNIECVVIVYILYTYNIVIAVREILFLCGINMCEFMTGLDVLNSYSYK